MKKKVLSILICLFLIFIVSGCVSGRGKEKLKYDSEGYLIGISNGENNNNFQVKVIIDKINIRAEASVNSEKKGVVQKDSIFDVINYQTDKKYVWFQIETNNGIKGYIASEIESPYVTMNREIDITPPNISFNEDMIKVSNRTEIKEKLENITTYIDDKDQNLTMDYTINYDSPTSTNTFPIEVTVKDSSNNVATATIKVKITSEQKMKDGTWLTYSEMIEKQNKAIKLCKNYGLIEWRDGMGCTINYGYDISIGNSGTTRIGYNYPHIFCDYDHDLTSYLCIDENGNEISHDLISNKLKSLEEKWLPKFNNYLNEVKEVTGYSLYELIWETE